MESLDEIKEGEGNEEKGLVKFVKNYIKNFDAGLFLTATAITGLFVLKGLYRCGAFDDVDNLYHYFKERPARLYSMPLMFFVWYDFLLFTFDNMEKPRFWNFAKWFYYSPSLSYYYFIKKDYNVSAEFARKILNTDNTAMHGLIGESLLKAGKFDDAYEEFTYDATHQKDRGRSVLRWALKKWHIYTTKRKLKKSPTFERYIGLIIYESFHDEREEAKKLLLEAKEIYGSSHVEGNYILALLAKSFGMDKDAESILDNVVERLYSSGAFSQRGNNSRVLVHESSRYISSTLILEEADNKGALFNRFLTYLVMHKYLGDLAPESLRYHERGVILTKQRKARKLEEILGEMDSDKKTDMIGLCLRNLAMFNFMLPKECEIEYNGKRYMLKPCAFDYKRNIRERAFLGKETDKRLRLGDTNMVHEFLECYDEFIGKRLGNSQAAVLHCDFYPTNVLEDGTIIDPKFGFLVIGDPMLDATHFLGHPKFRKEFMEYYKRLYLEEAGKHSYSDGKSFDSNMLHNSLCLLGSMLNQGNYEYARHYLRLAIDYMIYQREMDMIKLFITVANERGCFSAGDLRI